MEIKHIDFISPYTGKSNFIEFTATNKGVYYRRKSYPDSGLWQFQPFLLPMFAPLILDLISKASSDLEFRSILVKYGPGGYYRILDYCTDLVTKII